MLATTATNNGTDRKNSASDQKGICFTMNYSKAIEQFYAGGPLDTSEKEYR